MKIENVEIDKLQKGDWHANHILKPDLRVLARSIADFGFLSPIVVMKRDMAVIDGYHRWMVVKENKELRKTITHIPCIFIDCDSLEASMLHLRLNRSKGTLVAHRVSDLVKQMVRSKKYTDNDLAQLLSMTDDELDVLLDGTIIKRVNISEHKYSRAWVPIEAPKGAVDTFVPEKPPNPDR
jgi:ParB-like chromosome segregation protein Spo0J